MNSTLIGVQTTSGVHIQNFDVIKEAIPVAATYLFWVNALEGSDNWKTLHFPTKFSYRNMSLKRKVLEGIIQWLLWFYSSPTSRIEVENGQIVKDNTLLATLKKKPKRLQKIVRNKVIILSRIIVVTAATKKAGHWLLRLIGEC
ncbi:hypothetical protein Nepgr_031259 [Nepenthes gracilis]|uniref:Uncharacterized protein n=1 Tax=Nepenthes gracilis TaxID=150966 RepID=A0AAD3Y7D3_NEPGR|nr:hypothetical protein Nepgr_031259 [Nepenthes gracilis]